jgi:hypothetical protein
MPLFRIISRTVDFTLPIRFVNQLESGTSPRVLTFRARAGGPVGAFPKKLSKIS